MGLELENEQSLLEGQAQVVWSRTGQATQYQLDASGTRYRLVTVPLGDGQRLVAAEPTSDRPFRTWYTFSRGGFLTNDYVAEKLNVRATEDLAWITLLVGYALGRDVGIVLHDKTRVTIPAAPRSLMAGGYSHKLSTGEPSVSHAVDR